MRLALVLFISIFACQMNAQVDNNNFSFIDTSVREDMHLTIQALDYTNELDKYTFDKIKIDSLVYFLNINNSVSIEIVCNSDYTNSPLLSMMATTEQANDIRNYIIRKGIKGSRIEIYGNGELSLLEYDNSESFSTSDKKNRRIEIKIIGIKEKKTNRPSGKLRSYLN